MNLLDPFSSVSLRSPKASNSAPRMGVPRVGDGAGKVGTTPRSRLGRAHLDMLHVGPDPLLSFGAER